MGKRFTRRKKELFDTLTPKYRENRLWDKGAREINRGDHISYETHVLHSARIKNVDRVKGRERRKKTKYIGT